MAGRPRKYANAEQAAAAKLAKDRAYSQQQRKGRPSSQGVQFILYEPTQQDAPPLTSSTTAIRSNLYSLPEEEDASPTFQEGIVMSQAQHPPQHLQAVPAPAPLVQAEETEVEEAVSELDVQEEINEEREAAIILQALQQCERKAEEPKSMLVKELPAATIITSASASASASATTSLTIQEEEGNIQQASAMAEGDIGWLIRGDDESQVESQIFSEMSQHSQSS